MSTGIDFDPVPQIAAELELPPTGVGAAVELLAAGNTVPFIARYRKEATGGLDDEQLHRVAERREYLVELEKRRQTMIASIEEQGRLDDELRAALAAATTKSALEDLYAPFRPKRRTRATMARERGLEPLATMLLEQPAGGDPRAEAGRLVDPERGVDDIDSALSGARDIVAEIVAERAEVRAQVRGRYGAGVLRSRGTRKAPAEGSRFRDYLDHREPVPGVPSHRFLAMRRGEREGELKLSVEVDDAPLSDWILSSVGHDARSPFAGELRAAVEGSLKRLLGPSAENDVRADLKERSDRAAVEIFSANLANLLLAAPFGGRPVLGVDPGLRTGCKCAAVDATGKFVGEMVFHAVRGDGALETGRAELAAFVERHRPQAVAVGNGTGNREAEAVVRGALDRAGAAGRVPVVSVNEAGASVYSASEVAREEFPDLDVTVRGAISIARRLQDPLAELVKIEPRSIGVGQYQHDVQQSLLERQLDRVVESCVNRVGVELNTASAALLARVAGIGPVLARNIVAHRDEHGAFASRAQIKKVPRLGPRAFEQCAGFLRTRGGANPLDASAVHPERYALVKRMAADLGVGLGELVGSVEHADRIDIRRYVGDGVGEPTLRDILDELKLPGRDPREAFEAPAFRDDVSTIEDLEEGMRLQGVVTNVTAFGAFVDVGVHRDGLVHVSELADRFVKDPAEVTKVGDRLEVRVIGVDLERGRISLSARSERAQRGGGPRGPKPAAGQRPPAREQRREGGKQQGLSHNPFADLLKK